MVWEREKSTFKYFLCGILLLHSMCDLASRVPKIEQESHTIPNDMVLLHAVLVACSLQLLTVIVSPHYQEVAQVLTAYYKVYIFKEAAFVAVCVDVKYLQTNDSSRSASPTTEETLNHLWQHCDSSLQFLQPMCQQKLFRECIVNNQVIYKSI
ncbi:uncharacterized protein LOC121746129 isoform X2 [Salvia splendens]|uniref:uncharacterized protein LOC121746129 isoform X2 n=1 Tax=Salvia splendens TaxID=180675 RepID=UPI001C279B08|nr:uncharacterized protein LOC121746129 isoform X2 [Salvia splendens]